MADDQYERDERRKIAVLLLPLFWLSAIGSGCGSSTDIDVIVNFCLLYALRSFGDKGCYFCPV